jgi:hypothetical protein
MRIDLSEEETGVGKKISLEAFTISEIDDLVVIQNR